MGCSNTILDLSNHPGLSYHYTKWRILQFDSTYIDYQWFDSNGTILGASNFYYSPPTSGMYWVEVVDSSGCSGASLDFDFLFSLHLSFISWKVYPIPAVDNLYLESDSGIDWIISDSQGKLLMKGACFSNAKIDVSNLSEGVYILQVLKENTTYFEKIIKQ